MQEVQQEESWFEVALDKIKTRLIGFLRRHWAKFLLGSVLCIVMLFLLRAQIQPMFLLVREYSFILVFFFGYLLFLSLARRIKLSLKLLIPLTLLVICSMVVYVLTGTQQYIAGYLRQQALQIVELDTLPLTVADRVQPLDSIYVQASEKINETESVTIPDLVLEDGKQKWSMEIFPTYLGQKLLKGKVKELFVISATSASPDFSRREEVSFGTGEHLLFSRNVRTNAIKALNPYRYFNHFPTNVKVVPDGDGNWVQLVSLARYRGLFFPHIEFAGVHIIRQTSAKDKGIFATFKRITLGVGEFVPRDEISRYDFLKGQNLIPYLSSKRAAESFKFQKGFLSPIRSYHEGDIRIPEMEGNNNEMPYVLLFDGLKGKKGLYHYFGLEPFDEKKHGLSLSLFIPGDGIDPNIYIYDHANKKESLTGASAIATKVMESKKNYDWSTNEPVETRPYIKDVSGQRRFFWLTTVATVNEEGGLAGSIPEIVVTDAATNFPIWVDSKNPQGWLKRIEEQIQYLVDK